MDRKKASHVLECGLVHAIRLIAMFFDNCIPLRNARRMESRNESCFGFRNTRRTRHFLKTRHGIVCRYDSQLHAILLLIITSTK